MKVTEQDVYYLSSIRRQLKDMCDTISDAYGPTLTGEAGYDNLNYLDELIAAVKSEVSSDAV